MMLGGGLLCGAGAEVMKGRFSKTMVLTGFLQAKKAERLVVPRSNSWQVQVKWMAPEGSDLKPGDVAVRFDTASLASDIENLELTLEDKLQEMNQKQSDCKMEKKNLELKLRLAEIDVKTKDLDAGIPKGLVADYEYEKNQLELKKSIKAREKAKVEQESGEQQMATEVERLNIEIQEAKAKLEKYRKMLGSLTLRAKNGGTLMYEDHPWHNRKLQIGDNVGATWTVATIPDPQSLYVEAWANESGVKSLQPGQKVTIVMDAYPQKKFSGVVEDVMNNAEKKNRWGRSHYFQVNVELDALEKELMKPGMSVRCEVQLAARQEALLIPLEMVRLEDGDYWICPAGEKPRTITSGIVGMNEFYLALEPDHQLGRGTKLAPVGAIPEPEVEHE